MRVFNPEKNVIEKRLLTGITLDSNGVYIAVDIAMQLYFWNFNHEIWIPIQTLDPDRPEDC